MGKPDKSQTILLKKKLAPEIAAADAKIQKGT